MVFLSHLGSMIAGIVSGKLEIIYSPHSAMVTNIRPQISYGNSFWDDETGGERGFLNGWQDGMPRWRIVMMLEWNVGSIDAPETSGTFPHVMLVVCTEDEAPGSDKLLFSELACITQALSNRLAQKEFENSSHFSVSRVKFSVVYR